MNKNASTTTPEAAAVAEQGAHVTPKKATSKGKGTSKKNAPKGKTGTKGQKDTKPASNKASKTKDDAKVPREFSRKAIVLDLLRRKNGATMAEIAKATDWQNHSIRGFISGNVGKKMGLAVESTKNEAGERVYRIAK
jgi:Protein of unknown function (DUF3489)